MQRTDAELDALLSAAVSAGTGGSGEFNPAWSNVVPFFGGNQAQLPAHDTACSGAERLPNPLLYQQNLNLAALLAMLRADNNRTSGQAVTYEPADATGSPLPGVFSDPCNACSPLPGTTWPEEQRVTTRSLSASLPLNACPAWHEFATTSGSGGGSGNRGRRQSFDVAPRTAASPAAQPLPPVASLLPSITNGQAGCRAHNPLYKTELCRGWLSTGFCRYGDKCQFAHGESDLRLVQRHPKFKTKVCIAYATTGSCPYGSRCRFIHSHNVQQQQLQLPSPTEL